MQAIERRGIIEVRSIAGNWTGAVLEQESPRLILAAQKP
jgi:hypothetical protein